MYARQLSTVGLAAVLALGAVTASAQDGDDPVVGLVDGAEIRQSDILSAHEGLPDEYKAIPVERIHRILLDRAIDDALIAARAVELNYDDDAEVQRKLREARAQVYREIYFERVIIEAVTEETQMARYDELIKDAPAEEEVRARHVLVETEDEAKAVIDQLGAADADFAKVAEEKSIGPSGPQGGDLGYFTQEVMVPEFAEAAFAMAPGDVSSEPVQTQFGWHVIKVEDRREKAPPSFEEMQEQILTDLSQEAIATGIVNLREGHEIERFGFDGSAMAEPNQE